MGNAAKAFLKSEGAVDYRGCGVCYYTYIMENKPNKYRVNVNVHLRHDKNDYTMSLALDKSFNNDEDAIKYGIAQGEKFIDKSYKEPRIT